MWLTPVSLGAADSAAPPVGERNVDGIMDNSFLVEEAYNQEKGVVQHVFTAWYTLDRQPGPDDHLWALNFTQEWPLLGQTHQLSYSIPYFIARTGDRTRNGFGDVFLNYRFQAYFNEETLTAFAPRASLILPTGEQEPGFGEDTVGAQFNLPFSTTLNDRWFTHLNAGLTWLPHAASVGNRDLLDYNLGASVIYAHTRDLHFLVEWVGYWIERREPGRCGHYEFSTLLSPGLRKAFNFPNKSQLVLGVASPIGLTTAAPDFGVFFYASFEHFFTRSE